MKNSLVSFLTLPNICRFFLIGIANPWVYFVLIVSVFFMTKLGFPAHITHSVNICFMIATNLIYCVVMIFYIAPRKRKDGQPPANGLRILLRSSLEFLIIIGFITLLAFIVPIFLLVFLSTQSWGSDIFLIAAVGKVLALLDPIILHGSISDFLGALIFVTVLILFPLAAGMYSSFTHAVTREE